MLPEPSAPAFEPNTCYMGTGESYGSTVPSAPPQPEFEGYTPGWSYTDYAKRESTQIPVELTTKIDEKPHSKGREKLDTQCRVCHHISWILQLGALASLVLAPFIDWYIAITSAVLICLYFTENLSSTTFSYMKNFMWRNEAVGFIQKLRETPPIISFEIQCYHYETRTRTVRDSDGKTRTETYTVRVNTHSASRRYNYDIFKDYTQFPPFAFGVMKMSLKEFHAFEDSYTEQDFNNCKNAFIRGNNLDTYYDFWIHRSIPGMRNRVLVETEPGATSRYWTSNWFCCSMIFCWAPCFRMWFLKYTGKEQVRITKSIQKLPEQWYRVYIPVVQPNIAQTPQCAGVLPAHTSTEGTTPIGTA